MVCILLPDFPSSLVASVLSILYYGEVWLSQLSHQVCVSVGTFDVCMCVFSLRDQITL